MLGIIVVATRARIHGCHELETARKLDVIFSSIDRNKTILKRLPERLKCRTAELGKLVKKEHAIMGQ